MNSEMTLRIESVKNGAITVIGITGRFMAIPLERLETAFDKESGKPYGFPFTERAGLAGQVDAWRLLASTDEHEAGYECLACISTPPLRKEEAGEPSICAFNNRDDCAIAYLMNSSGKTLAVFR